jgi:flagellar motor switch protein FliM
MSSGATKKLSQEKIRQLLVAVGSGPLEDTTQIEAREYNWHQPHCFDRNQLNKLDDFTKKVTRAIAAKFADFCHGEFDVTVVSTTQHFAAELLDQALDGSQNEYYLAFGTDQESSSGLIGIPTQTAFIWATQLLGDTESEEDSRVDLSLFEESLLLDIASAIVEALSEAHGYCDFQPAGGIVRRLLSIELKGTEELCKITFQVKGSHQENSSEAYILILCSKLEPVVGKAEQAVGAFSAEDVSNAILSHVQQMSVSITAQLASTSFTLGELMGLEANDILLLDKRIDEPVELIVNGRMALCGRPAKSAGKYAVVVTGAPELSCDTE